MSTDQIEDISYEESVERHRKNRHRKLLRQSAAVFAKSGALRMSMDKLGKELGISKVVLYRYFNSKDDLINLMLSEFSDQLLDTDSRDLGWGRKVVSANLTVVRQNQDAFLFLMRHTIHDPKFGHHYKRIHDQLVENTIERITKDYSDIENDVIDVEFFSRRLCTFVLDSIKGWVETGNKDKDREFVRWVVQSMAGLGRSWSEPPS
jgi:AcrR family transcriptional regulator